MDAREERLAKNEVVFRDVNERIAGMAAEHAQALRDRRDVGLSASARTSTARCGCRLLRQSTSGREATPPSSPFALGHELPEIEEVVFVGDTNQVVRKHGEAAAIAEAQDPRDRTLEQPSPLPSLWARQVQRIVRRPHAVLCTTRLHALAPLPARQPYFSNDRKRMAPRALGAAHRRERLDSQAPRGLSASAVSATPRSRQGHGSPGNGRASRAPRADSAEQRRSAAPAFRNDP